MLLFEVCKEKGWGRTSVSPGTFKDWQEQNRSFSALGAFAQTPMVIGLKEGAQNVPGLRISPELWDVLKIHPCGGRSFLTEESQPGRDNVALISHELWMRQFAGSEQVLGRALEINGSPHVIVGIMPKGVRFPFHTEIWTPLVTSGKDREQRDRHELLVAGRLRDQTPLKRALAEISGITRRIAERYPKTNHGWDCLMLPLRSLFVNGDEVQTFTALFLGGLFVLLTACANVANLLAARFGRRQKEMAIRMSLGASGQRIVRLVLTESLVLSAMGTAVGILLAFVRIQEQHPAVMGTVRLVIRRFDSNLGEPRVRTMAEALADVFESRRLVLWLLGAFSGVSLVLAVLGIYGVLSYLVSQRRRELGIRLALGARPRDLIVLVVRQGMFPVLIGIGCGVIGSLVLRDLLKHQIIGIGGVDPIGLRIP